MHEQQQYFDNHRVIIHLDLDCFYAQVEQQRLQLPREDPIAVQQWGSILAVNYPARKEGVKRGKVLYPTVFFISNFFS
jgi:nucleotidyltransferase/DNA polymerase involved in DNA repair